MHEAVPGAPRDRVAARLKVLEQAGVIAREQYQSSPPRFDYVLTDAGRGLIPVLRALLSWGREYAVASDDPVNAEKVTGHRMPARA